MTSIGVLIVFIGLLFLVPFITKQRLGTPALALAAGATLAHMWVGDVTPIVASTGLILVRPPLESVVFTMIVLLPAFLVMLNGPRYSTLLWRVFGSLVFALLAVALLIQTFGSAVVIEGAGKQLYDFLVAQQALLITVGLVLALGDLLISRRGAKHPKHFDKH